MSPTIAPAVPYAEARRATLAAAESAGATLSVHAHPSPGPEGEALATDVLRFGAPVGLAEDVLLLLSGTHGVEGHAGSGLQRNLIASGRLGGLPPGVAVVLVHAVNPYGMAWTRRVDHQNVDVNRNFVDPADLPENPLYGEVDHLLNPTDAELDLEDSSFVDGLMAFMGRVGELTAFRTLNGGQYSHPHGVQFGGQEPTWSRRTLEAIWDEQLVGARRAVNLDVHTGLGPTGGLTVFQTADEDEVAAELGRRWFPEHMWRADRSTHDPIDHGLLGPGFDSWAAARGPAAPAETGTFVVEFGTLDVVKGITAFRADNWLAHHGDRSTPTGQAIVQLMLDQFYVDDDGWRTAIAEQGEAAIHTALDGIAER